MPPTNELSLAPERWPADGGTVPSLDGMRALSILLVLFGHFLLPPSISGIGAFGVTVFFFISGFLITRLLFAEIKAKRTIGVKNFYLRRFLRLYPVIVVSITLCVGFAIVTQRPVDAMEVSSVFLYFTNYLVAYREFHPVTYTLPISAFWSLSVEEHYYLIFPAMFVFLKGNPLRIAYAAVATCVLCLAVRCIYLIAWPEMLGTLATYWRSETRFDAIGYGVLMATLCEMPKGRKAIALTIKPQIVAVAAVAILISFAFRNKFYQNSFRFSIQDIALFPVIGSFIFAARFSLANRLLNSAILVWIGKLSYSLYVWHGAVIYLLSGIALIYLPPFAHQPFLFAFSFVAAILSYFLLEMPFIRLRKKLRR
jgi:peptidoglycan/LPS O-acetylase OafA/YrhL